MSLLPTAPIGTAWACGLAPQLGEDQSLPPPFADLSGASPDSGSAPLTESIGRLDLRVANSLMPSLISDCGRRISAAILRDRLKLDVARADNRPTFAALSGDLTPDGSPVSWDLETSFLAPEGAQAGDSTRYFGARNGIGLLDGRLRASADFGLSMDESEEARGQASRYDLAADLLRQGPVSLTGRAGFALSSPGYVATGADVTADREVREVGALVGLGRFSFDLGHSVSRDNTEDADAQATRHWRVWRASLGIGLPELPAYLPQHLGFKIARHSETAEDAVDAGALSRTYALDFTWRQEGGSSLLSLVHEDRQPAAGEVTGATEDRFGLSLHQSVKVRDWNLTATADWRFEAGREDGTLRRARSLDLGLNLATAPFLHGALELGGSTHLTDAGPHGPLENLSVNLGYRLSF